MDETLHGATPGRNEAGDESRNNPAAPTPEIAGSGIVVICAWCPELHILKIQRREEDCVSVFQQGKYIRISRNGKQLEVSHGICEPCRAKHFGAVPKKEEKPT